MLGRSHMLQALLSQRSCLQQAGVLLQAVHNCSSAVHCLHAAAGQSQPQHTAAPCSSEHPTAVMKLPESQQTLSHSGRPQQLAGPLNAPVRPLSHLAAGWRVGRPDLQDRIATHQGSSSSDRSGSSIQLQEASWPPHRQGQPQLQPFKSALQQTHTTLQCSLLYQAHTHKHSTGLYHTTTTTTSSSSSSSGTDASGAQPPSSIQAATAPASAASNRAEALPGDAFEDEGEVLLDDFEIVDEASTAAWGVVDSEWTNEGAVSTSQHHADYADSADEYDVEFDEDFDFEDEEGLQDTLPAQESSNSV